MIVENIKQVEENIKQACEKVGRNPEEVTLIAVSKTKPYTAIEEALPSGILDYGENKVQELCDKFDILPKNIRWHMIGHLQRNKVKYLVGKVQLIHSVDSLRLAEQIEKETDKEVRITVPGHTQRGGTPCAYDRVFATRVGAKAAELILNEEYGYMVAMRNGETVKVPLEEVAGKLKYVDPNCGLIKEARTIGISFGDEV